jgi:CheY-like chemotaxis protein
LGIGPGGPVVDRVVAMKLLRALIVDPDGSVRSVMSKLLDRRAFDTVEAVDIVGALGFALDGSIDLIIADIDLDELDGLQLLRIIRNGSFGKSPPPVIVCSAILNEEIWTMHPALKGVTRLPKPFTSAAFTAALDQALPAG